VSNSGYVDVHMVQSPWTESGITAANAPTIDPVPIAAFRVLGSDLGGFVTADVTLAAQAWAASPGTNYGLALLPSPRESISIDLHSRESSNPGSLLINGGSSDGNAPPTARDDDYSVSSGSGSRTFDVLDNDSDPDEPGDTIRVFSVTPASNGGTVVNNITGIRYTPAPGFVGTETFDYTIADEAGLTSTATVTVNVSGGGSSQTWRIMPVGDSITEASGSRNSYRRPLWHSLNDAGYDINFVGSQSGNRDGQVPNPDFDTDHEGHWGWRADRFLNNNNIRNWATTHRPDVVLIHLGTNDIFNGQSVSGTINEISQIIDEMRSVNPDIIVLVAQIIPTSDPGRPSLDPFNDAIPGLVASKNTSRSPVRLVDQNSGFNASVDTYDGIHPDLSGETKMAAKWFEALVPLLSN
jgi:lysophospholipase L1-like esterase